MPSSPAPESPSPLTQPRAWYNRDGFALTLLTFLFVYALYPILVQGHVAAPVDQRKVLGVAGEANPAYPAKPYFSDVNRFFIPKLQHHFHSDHTGWNATWDPHTQLGKPVSHFGGYSKAYPITYALSWLSTDAYRLHAWLSVVTVAMLTLFAYLFMRSMQADPAAAFVVAAAIGLNPRSIYWFGFAQLIAWATWSMGALWLSVSFAQRRRALTWIGLVFVTYCAIIGSRHQATIRSIYMMAPFVLLFVLMRPESRRERAKTLGYLLAAVLLALALAFPLVNDMVDNIRNSTRGASDTTEFVAGAGGTFYTRDLPELWHLLAAGSPNDPSFPDQRTPALTLTPFFMAMLGVAIVTPNRRAAALLAVALLFIAMSISGPVHTFAIRYLGFGFSRSNPIGGVYLPAFLLCGFAIDRLLKHESAHRWRCLAAAGTLTCIGVWATFANHPRESLHAGYMILAAALAVAAFAFIVFRATPILYAVGIALVVFYAAPCLVHRPPEDIARSSPLTEALEAATQGGFRYAKLQDAAPLIPSNMEALTGLASIHSYDSVSAAHYTALAGRLSDGSTRIFGRHFDALDNTDYLSSSDFALCGVNTLISRKPVQLPGWRSDNLTTGQILHHAERAPRLIAQTTRFEAGKGREIRVAADALDEAAAHAVRYRSRVDNFASIATTSLDSATLLFVSGQYHRDWTASAGDTPLKVVRVNDFFLGVELPPRTTEVTLEFRPLARYAWFPLAFFPFAFLVTGVSTAFPRRGSPESDASKSPWTRGLT